MTFIRAAVVILFIEVIGLAQTTTPQSNTGQLPTFRAQTELVQVPVIVTKGGKHVPGLTKDDFTIMEDGVARPVAFFEDIKAIPEAIRPVTPPPGTYNNEVSAGQQPTEVVILVLDALNTPALQQADARQKIVEFLAHTAESRQPILVAMIGRQGLKIIHPFTTSPEVLLAAVRKVKTNMEGSHETAEDKGFVQDLQGTGSISQQIDVTKESADIGAYISGSPRDLIGVSAEVSAVERRAEITLIAMEQLVRSVGGIQGRKAMLWATGGTVCDPGASIGGLHQGLIDKCNRVWHLLSTNNIAVYPIDAGQTVNPGFVGAGQMNPNRNEPRGMQTQLIFESYAKYTGGKVCTFRNDDSCYRQAMDDSSQYYLLSYYTTPMPKPTWRKISVKVRTPGASVRARNGYMTGLRPADLEEQRKNDVAMAVISPVDYTGIPLTVRWLGAAEKDGKRQYRFQVVVAPGGLSVDENEHNHIKVSIIAYAEDAKGNHVGDVTKDLNAHMQDRNYVLFKEQGFGYTDALEVPPGEFTVKFIVRDDLSGKMGTVTAPTPKLVPST